MWAGPGASPEGRKGFAAGRDAAARPRWGGRRATRWRCCRPSSDPELPPLLGQVARHIGEDLLEHLAGGGPLHEGTLEGTEISCPWHDSVFDVRDGSLIHGPAAYPQPAWETRVRHGRIEVRRSSLH